MASTYSQNLRLELIGTGDQQGTWGITTNTNLGTLLEEAIGGYVSVTVNDSSTPTTLTTNNGTSDQSRNMTINLTGTLTSARSVICPAIEKVYIVKNSTSGGYSVQFKVTGQTGVTIPNGSTYFLYVDGIDARVVTASMAAQAASGVDITGGTINVGDAQTPRSDLQISGTTAPTATMVGSISGKTLDVSSVVSGTLSIGDRIFVGGVDYNTYIVALGTGTGGVGTYTLSQQGTLTAGTTFRAYPAANNTLTIYNSDTTNVANQPLGAIEWYGSDSSVPGAGVKAYIAAISESTTPDSALAFGTSNNTTDVQAVERGRFTSNGDLLLGYGLGVGTYTLASTSMSVSKQMTGDTVYYGFVNNGQVQSDVTSQAIYNYTLGKTAAASFTLGSMIYNIATQGTFGAGSSVTSQYGYLSSSSLIGATSNFAFLAQDTSAVTSGKSAYGFYSSVNTASGGGTSYSVYSAGTASSVFSGSIGIGTTTLTGINLRVAKSVTGNTTSYNVLSDGQVQSDVNVAYMYSSNPSTANATFTLASLYHYNATQGTFGSASTVTSQVGYLASGTLKGATNNYLFYAATTGSLSGKTAYGFYTDMAGSNTYAFYSASTAPSVFNGNVTISGSGLFSVTSGLTFGYGYGVGGTVTQTTSRTTGVTLNKPCGKITLVSAAGSTAWQSFTVSSNSVGTDSVIIVNQVSGTDLYEIHITNITLGTFRISFRTTGGTTTEQPVFSYAILTAPSS